MVAAIFVLPKIPALLQLHRHLFHGGRELERLDADKLLLDHPAAALMRVRQ